MTNQELIENMRFLGDVRRSMGAGMSTSGRYLVEGAVTIERLEAEAARLRAAIGRIRAVIEYARTYDGPRAEAMEDALSGADSTLS